MPVGTEMETRVLQLAIHGAQAPCLHLQTKGISAEIFNINLRETSRSQSTTFDLAQWQWHISARGRRERQTCSLQVQRGGQGSGQ